jgi:hypothetical protein
MTRWKSLLIAACVFSCAGYAYWRLAIPTHRTVVRSELMMLGDLDGDLRWTSADIAVVDALVRDPFGGSVDAALRIDLNQNSMVDEEDLGILRGLVKAGGDPYAALREAQAGHQPFPRPRELYRYVSLEQFPHAVMA